MRQTLKEYINSEVQVRYNKDTGKEDGLFSDVFGEDRMIMGYNEKYLMKVIVDTIVKPGGSLLNIGYGLGYFDTWAWKLGVNSHHIIECHPDVIPKAIAWALDKPNVTIVSQSWYDAFLNGLETYDGIFSDPYLDETIVHFSSSLETLCNAGCKVTWWNNTRGQVNDYGFDDSTITYDVLDCTPTINDYYKGNKYYLPKFQYV